MTNNLNVKTLGQVFTQEHTVDFMLSLRKNNNSILEPSCGAGAFSDRIKNEIGFKAIEFDKKVCPNYAEQTDFFEFDRDNKEKFNTIIGNPPFVKYKDIHLSTKEILESDILNKFDGYFGQRTNLYMFFIHKCLYHLNIGGELIFINPRDFLKATSSIKLNNLLFSAGTITDIIDLGDTKLFNGFSPNCVIWRFELGNLSRKTNFRTARIENNKIKLSTIEERKFTNVNGQLMFLRSENTIPFSKIFYVKVGAVSGADDIFTCSDPNGKDATYFITSETRTTGLTKRFYYNVDVPQLKEHKEALLNRKIKSFTEDIWYTWGRNLPPSIGKRAYVNCKTRQKNPFFTHVCNNFDGSVLAIFLKNQELDLAEIIQDLNYVNWEEMGFVADGRFLFSQKSLENCLLPKYFEKYLNIS
jgi:adenine-specific DNA-methyltransferase